MQDASVLLDEAGHVGQIVVHRHLADLHLSSAAEDREGGVVADQQAQSVRGELHCKRVVLCLREHLGHPELPHRVIVQSDRHFL